jgi:hypothetical protein
LFYRTLKDTMKKETIKPPPQRDVSTAAKQLRHGGSSAGPAGRVMADRSVAVRQGVSPKKK